MYYIGNKIVHAKVEGENIYFQIAWTSGELICRAIRPDGVVLTFEGNTYHGTYAQCSYWNPSENDSVWPIELELNGVVYRTDEITAVANGPIIGMHFGYTLKMRIFAEINLAAILLFGLIIY